MNFKLIPIVFIVLLQSCKSSKVQKPFIKKKDTFYEDSSNSSKNLYTKENIFIENLISKDSLKYQQNKNFGFWYCIENPKKQIKSNSEVSFTFKVKRASNNKNLIYSSKKMTVKIDKTDIIKGLNEGLKLMGENQKGVFIFPSYLAYGLSGDGKKVKGDTPLIYEVEILGIK